MIIKTKKFLIHKLFIRRPTQSLTATAVQVNRVVLLIMCNSNSKIQHTSLEHRRVVEMVRFMT